MKELVENLVAQALSEGYVFFSLSNNLAPLLQNLRRYVGNITYTDLKIYSAHHAKPNTMSRLFGEGEFPHHTDFAFRPLPPRFILLVNDTSSVFNRVTYVTPFKLLKNNEISKIINSAWTLRTKYGVFHVNGGFKVGNFYVLRWDTVFLEPNNQDAIDCTNSIYKSLEDHQVAHGWSSYSGLLIDNWSCTHARGSGSFGVSDKDRQLKRYEVWHHARMG